MASTNIDEVAPLMFHYSRVPTKADNRTQFQKRLTVWLILLAVGLERLAFYSLAGNLILFLTSTNIQWTTAHSTTASFIFYGTSYISALIFSWISDAKLGRAKTILIGFAVYMIGYIFIPLFSKVKIFELLCNGKPHRIEESAPYFEEKCSAQITAALVVTSIGVGAVHANMAIFGAEQIRDQKGAIQYFDKYYVAVNIGSLLAFGIVAYIQQNDSYFLGYIISTAVLAVTILIFSMGYRCYIRIKPHDSVITYFFPVLINAFQTWRKYRQHYENRPSREAMLSNDRDDNNNQSAFNMNERPISFFDYAKGANNGRFQDRVVDDIKSLRRIVAMFLLLIPYWLIYLQSETMSIVQAVHMKVPDFHANTRYMPIIWLSLSDQIIIIVIIVILNTCVYKRLRENNRSFSMKVRIVIGMISATLSMCMTGTVEIFRQQRCDSSFNQTIGHTTYNAADMSIFYQIPQYISIGLSEVFASVTSLEFAYMAAPQSAQSLVMSLRFCSAGISSFLSSGYLGIYESINENFTMATNECKDAEQSSLFYIYFFVLAGIQFIFIFVFLQCDRRFQILKDSQHRFNNRLFIGSSSGTSNA